MAKSTSKKLRRAKPSQSKTRKSKKRTTRSAARSEARTSASASRKSTERADSKRSQVIALLRAPSGATLDAMMRLTGWQQHSVRGFLAAVVRKKLALDLQSKPGDGGRVYRIGHRTSSSIASSKTAA